MRAPPRNLEDNRNALFLKRNPNLRVLVPATATVDFDPAQGGLRYVTHKHRVT